MESKPGSRKATSKAKKYHHYIPRFILRKFLEAQGPPKTVKERNKGSWKARNKYHIETELLNVYDISTKTLQHRPVAKLFGEKDLYNDKTDGISCNVEEKLSQLENQASRIINSIESATQKGSFTLTRESLGLLRKFVYVMHFRTASVRDRYFGEKKEEHMEDWINHYMEKHGLHSYQDVWLAGLSYVMDTPHSHIVREGEVTVAKYPSYQWHEMWTTRLDPSINYFAMDYEGLANTHRLGIWEAAPGTEFVMGNNSFGLWEGLMFDTKSCAHMLLSSQGVTVQIHRLFIVSPKLALVLRCNSVQVLSMSGWKMKSSLYDIEISYPQVHWHGSPFGAFGGYEEKCEYRATNIALKDRFSYSITKLTTDQTRAVNDVILLNIPDDGNLVFSSKNSVLEEVQAHITSPSLQFDRGNTHERYFPLVVAITEHSNIDIPQELDADRRLRTALEGMKMEFRSDWDEFFWFYRAMTADPKQQHPMALEMCTRLSHAKNRLKSFGAANDAETQQSQIKHAIVETLSPEDSTRVLGYTSLLINYLFNTGSTKKGTRAATVKGTMLVGIIEWLTEENPAFMKSVVGDDVFSRLVQPSHVKTKKTTTSPLGPMWRANKEDITRRKAEVVYQDEPGTATQVLIEVEDLPPPLVPVEDNSGPPLNKESKLNATGKVATTDTIQNILFLLFFLSILAIYLSPKVPTEAANINIKSQIS